MFWKSICALRWCYLLGPIRLDGGNSIAITVLISYCVLMHGSQRDRTFADAVDMFRPHFEKKIVRHRLQHRTHIKRTSFVQDHIKVYMSSMVDYRNYRFWQIFKYSTVGSCIHLCAGIFPYARVNNHPINEDKFIYGERCLLFVNNNLTLSSVIIGVRYTHRETIASIYCVCLSVEFYV